MKIWCVQLKRRLRRTDDSPLRHFPCIFLKFHGHFFTKLCLRSKKPLPLALHRRQHHSTMKGYKNWCNAMTSASTMVETMSKSSAQYVQYVHQMSIYMVCNIFLFFLNSPSELTFWITLVLFVKATTCCNFVSFTNIQWIILMKNISLINTYQSIQ